MTTTPILKVVIAGDPGVGKTSLVQRFCTGAFIHVGQPSVGVDFQSKLLELPEGPVKLSMWDLPGEQRFAAVRESFYRGSLAAALVYDLTVPETLKSLAAWYKEILRSVPNQRFVVVGNKSDLAVEASDRIGQELARVIRAEYIRTSALTGEGVQELFTLLAQRAQNNPAAARLADPLA